MRALMLRLALLAGGIGLGQIAVDSIARGNSVALLQLALAFVLLMAGSAGFIVPLLGESTGKEAFRDDA
jgi:succinate dehydrogenase hydrophobic anchor subunit